jgi:thiosulfate reductase cytochrome b subunit
MVSTEAGQHMSNDEVPKETKLRPFQAHIKCAMGVGAQAIARLFRAAVRYVENIHVVPVGKRLHPLPLRIMHWVNALAMIVMITSGWGIYDDYVIISGLHFPKALRLGDWAAESLLWHFAGMWFLAINGLIYLLYGAITGRFRNKLLPIRFSDVLKAVREALSLKIAHDDITHYNAVQKLLYIVVIVAGISQVATGLAIWKPIQFSWLVGLFGGFQGARLLHFLGMVVIVGFLFVHVALSLLVPSTLWAMITGGPRIPRHTSNREVET